MACACLLQFDYEGPPDPRRWAYQTDCNFWTTAWGEPEAQWYTEARAQNAWVSGGVLRLTARRESLRNTRGRRFTSSRLTTRGRGEWVCGRFEVRARLPRAARGLWPAVWMMPSRSPFGVWPHSGEIDIMEHVGWEGNGRVHISVHSAQANHRSKTQNTIALDLSPGGRSEKGASRSADAHAQFHVYSVEWDASGLRFFIDDSFAFEVSRPLGSTDDASEWPFGPWTEPEKRNPFHLILNVAVGGAWGGKHGIDDDAFPASMEISHVRVFQNQLLDHRRRDGIL